MYQQQKVSLKRKYANVSLKKKSGGDGCKLEENARRCWCEVTLAFQHLYDSCASRLS